MRLCEFKDWILRLPDVEVHEGQILDLVWPCTPDAPPTARFIKWMKGKPHVCAIAWTSVSEWFPGGVEVSVIEAVERNASLDRSIAEQICHAAGVDGSLMCSEIGWNEAMRILLLAELKRSVRCLVFFTVGCDPEGERAIFESLRAQDRTVSLIHLRCSTGGAAEVVPAHAQRVEVKLRWLARRFTRYGREAREPAEIIRNLLNSFDHQRR